MPKGPMKRGRKPKHRDPLDMSQKPHEPILSNVGALISNTDSNDELSEPPGVSIAFLSNMQGRKECDENPNKKRGRGNRKLRFYVDHLDWVLFYIVIPICRFQGKPRNL